MKINNKVLLGVLTGLVLIYVMTDYFKKNNSKLNFKTDIVTIDTTQVSMVSIKKAIGNNEEIIFSKQSNDWQVSKGNINSILKRGEIKSILNLLHQLKIERLVAKTKDKWKSYQLTDSSATKVSIDQNGKITNLYLGKIKYDIPTNQYNQPNFNGSTYIRVNNDPKCYAVKGLLPNTFNRDFNSWRNSDFLKVDKSLITQIEFYYPEQKKFTLYKKDSIWNIGNKVVDSAKLEQYLTTISFKNNSKFSDHFVPKGNPDYKLTIKGNNMDDVIIKTYKDIISEKYYLKSTLNPQVFFESDSTEVFKQLFVDERYFIER